MKNINRTPHQALAQMAGQANTAAQPDTLGDKSKVLVAELNILPVWNEHRQLLIRPRLHLL